MERKHALNIQELKKRLLKNNSNLDITENADMSKYTSFKAGGKAALLISAGSLEELALVLEHIADTQVPHMLLGNGSNTLFRDSGYEGAVVKLSDSFSYACIEQPGDGCIIRAGTSALLSSLAKTALAYSLTGLEFASGIPGSLGGALFMNAGAYGGEMKDVVVSVKAISKDGREVKTFAADELAFDYRYSAFQDNGYIALEACLKLRKGDKDEISSVMRELAAKRNSKQPVQYPSAGSTFKRPEGYFAGKLIEDAGLKGVAVGGAQVSTLHSGFIINRGGATATDIIQLITLVQNRVYDEFGVMLSPEVRIIG